MIIVSNHALALPDLSISGRTQETIVCRVNLAWFATKADVQMTLMPITTPVYLDFPQGRTKPPKPTITFDEAIELANTYEQVKYFAVSNIESAIQILGIRALLREGIEVVPKIETKRGVHNLKDIVEKAKVKYVMLDKEDLYTDLERDAHQFILAVDSARKNAKKLGITLLELQGVIFA